MDLRLHHIIHLYNVFRENGKENCAQLIEEEFNRMFGINDEHDGNVVSMNSLNIHDANDMQNHKLGDAIVGLRVPQTLEVRTLGCMRKSQPTQPAYSRSS